MAAVARTSLASSKGGRKVGDCVCASVPVQAAEGFEPRELRRTIGPRLPPVLHAHTGPVQANKRLPTTVQWNR